jgi:uncharacterized protein YgiM (DUF1202 family)
MRFRIWTVIGVVLLTVALSSCTTSRVARGPVATPVPTKTLRPTFTNTPAKPTMTAAPTAVPPSATPEAPTATPEPPTEVPSPTPEVSRLTANATVNVRSGPGTNYARISQLTAGQSFVITGKNPAGDWWQFDFNGRNGWVLADLVRASGGERVQVAANIAPPPTAAPRPTARPVARPQPQPQPQPQPPAAAKQFAQGGAEFRNADDTNFSVVTFWGRLGTPPGAPPGGFRLRVTAPSGTKEVPFDTGWQFAYTGLPSQFLYNAKAELPRTGGAFQAVVIDGAGNEVSDAITGTLLDRTHDVILFFAGR